ncbi:YibE/F family protein [Fructobacillus parabroussonetiae]|uniref:YibE/F family protein n=1 Tax=Fructobacillus parabroussonetiae TaxID=2713174 RepID=A0ABS5QXK7_9LACO|nr:YibE/F family protein [Fructobacillus parabroussonetiae]MBS9337939.1 YibE/F family protein [Fructobacillus parabroussonetiae]MCK8617861.1 YibE/F family protein [Fructobacillus parabroussonetiae]
MNAIVVLIVILFLSLLAVAGKQGMLTFFGLFLNCLLIFLLITLVNWGFAPMVVLPIMAILILSVAIYLSAGRPRVLAITWQTAVLVLFLILFLAYLAQHLGHLQGYTLENSDELEGLSLAVGIDFSNLAIIVMVISALGAIAEAAMAVTADLFEVVERTPTITQQSLHNQGQVIGSQILGTAINTLFFGMLGANIPLLVWFFRLHYSAAEFMNAKLLLFELVTMLLGMIGILCAIKLAIFMVEHAFEKEGRDILNESDL